MADIFHQLQIKATLSQVFHGVSTPAGLDAWWTKSSSGEPIEGTHYELGFGPGYDWRALVSCCIPNTEIEYKLVDAHEDWLGTRVGFRLEGRSGLTQVNFHHLNWPEANDHYLGSCYCWAMYLRLLKRYVERGELVPYEVRLDA